MNIYKSYSVTSYFYNVQRTYIQKNQEDIYRLSDVSNMQNISENLSAVVKSHESHANSSTCKFPTETIMGPVSFMTPNKK